MNTVSAPITAIQVGDIVVTGHGTQTITEHRVSKTATDFTYGALYVIYCEDGYRFSDTPNGFWYQIRKADPAAHKAAENAARAYATAWDNKR